MKTVGIRRGSPVLVAVVSLVLVTASVVLTNAWLAWRAHDIEWETASANTRNLTHAVASHVDSILLEVDRLLYTLSYQLERTDMSEGSLAPLQPVMVSYAAHADFLHGLFVYAKDGSWLVHTQPKQSPEANNADRDYFKTHRISPSTRILIGKPISSRSTGEWVVTISRRLADANGEFAGVVLATIKLDYLVDLFESFDIGNGGAITLSLVSGSLLVRRPFEISNVGRNILNNPL